MNRFSRVFYVLVFLLCGLSVYFFFPGRPVAVTIKEGSGASQVAAALKAKRVIVSATWFKVLVKLTGTGKRLMPGDYTFRQFMPAEEALYKLVTTTHFDQIKIVIPEGWRAEQVAERLEANKVTKSAPFLALVTKEKLEGYLFPSTYFFRRDMPAAEVAKVFTDEFDRRIRPLFAKGFPPGLDERKVLVVASIVEREAVMTEERPLIAAVYLNRVARRMRLEADPTTQYAIGFNPSYGWWKKALSYRDLKTVSPYNTYVANGLPPGPICSPGFDSVAAVMSPANLDALYFVADRKGKHVFNASFEEHKKAKRRIEREAREAARNQ